MNPEFDTIPARARWLGLPLLCGLLAGEVFGAGQTFRGDSNFLIETWETEDGLPDNSVTAMVQTPDGYLWLGTFEGLVRFDGVKFAVFDRSNVPELPSDGIVNLHLDRKGRLWVSTYGGLAVRDGNQWRQLTRIEGGAADYARTFTERSSGDLLITTFSGKLFEIAGTQITEFPPPPGEPGQGYLGGADEDGHWWAVQNKFVGRWENGSWVRMIFQWRQTAPCRSRCEPQYSLEYGGPIL